MRWFKPLLFVLLFSGGFLLILSVTGVFAWKHSYSGRVLDDTGKPVSDAEVQLRWDAHVAGIIGMLTMEGFDPHHPRDLQELTLKTDADGRFAFRAAGNYISGSIQKPGYYGAWVEFKPGDPNVQGATPVPLPRVLRPQAMVGKQVHLRLPAGSSRLQYDFLAGDCLPPLGSGVIADLEIEWTRPAGRGAEANGRAFKAHLVGAGNGAIYLPAPERRSSGPKRLQSLHEAPLEGYQTSPELGSSWRGGKVIFYLKIRAGQPHGPHYGKMLDPVSYWARFDQSSGDERPYDLDTFKFEYVINPSGDRGLEIDMNQIKVPCRRELEYAPEEF